MSMGSEVDFLHFDMFSTDGGVPVSNPVTMTASPSWDYAPVVDDVMTSVFDVHITQGQNLVSL